jgi:hypothetical protein
MAKLTSGFDADLRSNSTESNNKIISKNKIKSTRNETKNWRPI